MSRVRRALGEVRGWLDTPPYQSMEYQAQCAALLYSRSCSLHYDDCIKDRLLQFTTTSLLFADRGVDTNVISCNRLVLASISRALGHCNEYN